MGCKCIKASAADASAAEEAAEQNAEAATELKASAQQSTQAAAIAELKSPAQQSIQTVTLASDNVRQSLDIASRSEASNSQGNSTHLRFDEKEQAYTTLALAKPDGPPQQKLFEGLNHVKKQGMDTTGMPPPQTSSDSMDPPMITNDTSQESGLKSGQLATMLALGGFSFKARNDLVDEELSEHGDRYDRSDLNDVTEEAGEDNRLQAEDIKMAFG